MTMYDWGDGSKPFFSPADVPPREQGDFTPLPEGWYQVVIAKCERKATKAGDGEYLKIEMVVADGQPFANRHVFTNINLWNASEKAVTIARRDFADLVTATGLVQVNTPDDIIGRSVSIKLKIKPAQGGYDEQNEVKGYRSVDGAPAPQAKPAQQPARPANPNTPSWAKPKQ
jgi:hypothetical protein